MSWFTITFVLLGLLAGAGVNMFMRCSCRDLHFFGACMIVIATITGGLLAGALWSSVDVLVNSGVFILVLAATLFAGAAMQGMSIPPQAENRK